MEEEQWAKNGFQKKPFFNNFFDMSKMKINFKKFAVLNAYLLKSILIKNSQIKLKIKWPNDLLFERKKICGICKRP